MSSLALYIPLNMYYDRENMPSYHPPTSGERTINTMQQENFYNALFFYY
jgi:hypothetical protein